MPVLAVSLRTAHDAGPQSLELALVREMQLLAKGPAHFLSFVIDYVA
jgi:hypothetical protein